MRKCLKLYQINESILACDDYPTHQHAIKYDMDNDETIIVNDFFMVIVDILTNYEIVDTNKITQFITKFNNYKLKHENHYGNMCFLNNSVQETYNFYDIHIILGGICVLSDVNRCDMPIHGCVDNQSIIRYHNPDVNGEVEPVLNDDPRRIEEITAKFTFEEIECIGNKRDANSNFLIMYKKKMTKRAVTKN